MLGGRSGGGKKSSLVKGQKWHQTPIQLELLKKQRKQACKAENMKLLDEVKISWQKM